MLSLSFFLFLNSWNSHFRPASLWLQHPPGYRRRKKANYLSETNSVMRRMEYSSHSTAVSHAYTAGNLCKQSVTLDLQTTLSAFWDGEKLALFGKLLQWKVSGSKQQIILSSPRGSAAEHRRFHSICGININHKHKSVSWRTLVGHGCLPCQCTHEESY